jgi:hypothetical protein
MTAATLANNPFAMMTEPERVLEAIEKSSSLRSLNAYECHPLDNPQQAGPTLDPVLFDGDMDGETVEMEEAPLEDLPVRTRPTNGRLYNYGLPPGQSPIRTGWRMVTNSSATVG